MMNLNWNTEANRKHLETIKTAALAAIGIAFTIAELVLAIKNSNNLQIDDSSDCDCTYADAIEAIMDSDMFSTSKEEAARSIAFNADPELYKAVIAVVGSDMPSVTKENTIEAMFNHK